MEAPPSPLSSRPELRRSVVERSAVSAVLSWKCFSTGEVMGRWPAQGDEKHFSSNYRRWKRRPPLCHLDRSSEGAQWRDLRCQRSFPGNVFRPGDEKRVLFSNYCLLEAPPSPLSSRPELR